MEENAYIVIYNANKNYVNMANLNQIKNVRIGIKIAYIVNNY